MIAAWATQTSAAEKSRSSQSPASRPSMASKHLPIRAASSFITVGERIQASRSIRWAWVSAAAGDQVEAGAPLVRLEEA